jgi:hypothetical protein
LQACWRPAALKDKDDRMSEDDQMNSNGGSRLTDASPWRMVAVVAAMAVTALLAAACSGGGSHGSESVSSSDQNPTVQLDAYASCMRGHGDPSFYFTLQKGTPSPPPAGDMGSAIGGYMAYFDPSSPGYQPAKKACQHLSPFWSAGPGSSHQQFLRGVKFAECMRSHGYPNFADPNPTTGLSVTVTGSLPPSAITPQFQAASKKCGGPRPAP